MMQSAYLRVYARTSSLLSRPFIAQSRGRRERGQWECPAATRATRRGRQVGAPLGHLPICWVILVLSGETQHFRRGLGLGWGTAAASWRACPCGLRLLCRGGSGLPLSGANCTESSSSPTSSQPIQHAHSNQHCYYISH